MKTTKLIISISTTLLSTITFAQSLPVDKNARLTAGLLATFEASGYVGKDKVGVMPLFLYDNHRLYIEGTEAGVYGYKDDKHWLRGGLTYDLQSFNPDDTEFKTLNKRKASVNAHASYMYITPVGGFELKMATDVLGKSKGQIITLAHRSKFDLLDNKLELYPKFGVAWHSANYNDYYYGVSANEAIKSGIAQYQAKSGYSPFASISAKYQLGEHVGLFAHQRLEWLSSSQKSSPLTDDKLQSSTHLGLTYRF